MRKHIGMLATLSVVLFAGAGLFSQWWLNVDNKTEDVIVLPQQCYPQQQLCKFNVQALEMGVVFSKKVVYLQPFDIKVIQYSKDGGGIEQPQISFQMKNMNMGLNRYNLQASAALSEWKTRAVLPVCVSGRADWLAELEFVYQGKYYKLVYPLQAEQPPR